MKPVPTNRDQNRVSQPQIVSREEWQRARNQLLVKEKAATRARDALAAERRRLPMVDAPEKGQAFGQRTKQAMSELVFGKDVKLRPHTIDRYGRLVAPGSY